MEAAVVVLVIVGFIAAVVFLVRRSRSKPTDEGVAGPVSKPTPRPTPKP